jgi:DNA-binding transcriptional ArsR family regulator
MFETLADPMRRRIVEELRGGGRSVGSLVDVVDIRQSGVSRHLRILREAAYRDLWEGRLDRLEVQLGRRRQATGGGESE